MRTWKKLLGGRWDEGKENSKPEAGVAVRLMRKKLLLQQSAILPIQTAIARSETPAPPRMRLKCMACMQNRREPDRLFLSIGEKLCLIPIL
jgi:hypothetical protein